MKNIIFYCKTELKARGWTDTLIKRLLPKHDKEETNPHYACASPMKLYKAKRIERIEKKEEFKEALKAAEKRRQTAAVVAKAKRQKAIDYANNVDIDIPLLDKDVLFEEACRNYADWKEIQACLRGNIDYPMYEDVTGFDDAFHARNMCNYLRHCCTNYEEELSQLYGKVGVQEAHDILKRRINKKIYEVYPWLSRKKGKY